MRTFGFHRVVAPLLLAPVLSGPAVAEVEWPPVEPQAEMPRMRPVRAPRSVRPTPISDGSWRVIFRINNPDAQGMSLAGSFNGWNPAANQMQRDAQGGWSTAIFLPDGVHQYKFVADRDRWLADPINEEGVRDGHGGRRKRVGEAGGRR